MYIDHIFIFTNDAGRAADKLVDFGFVEGSSRVHVGQGTTNRKFYFENFFLEILWVHDQTEIAGEPIKSIGLWQRADYENNLFTPYGLCLVNTPETDVLFEKAFQYQPAYFSEGSRIAILKNESNPSLPWTFRLPFKGFVKNEKEPKTHPNGIKRLTKAVFEFIDANAEGYLQHFKPTICEFIKSDKSWLTLTFDKNCQNRCQRFEKLGLTIKC